MNRDQIREVLLAHGFKIKDGQTDLMPYVYEAVETLLEAHDEATLLAGFRLIDDDAKHEPAPHAEANRMPKFAPGDVVVKVKGSEWQGRVVGTYSTELTPEGYAVESSTHKGSVQIYPAAALEIAPGAAQGRRRLP